MPPRPSSRCSEYSPANAAWRSRNSVEGCMVAFYFVPQSNPGGARTATVRCDCASISFGVADIPEVQRRTLRLLFVSQVAGGIGVVIGNSVGALLAADMVSVGVSGLAQSSAVLGAALLAVPATRIVRRFGRGPSLSAAYVVAAL